MSLLKLLIIFIVLAYINRKLNYLYLHASSNMELSFQIPLIICNRELNQLCLFYENNIILAAFRGEEELPKDSLQINPLSQPVFSFS